MVLPFSVKPFSIKHVVEVSTVLLFCFAEQTGFAQTDPPNFHTLTATQAAEGICRGSLTSEQLVSAYIQRAKSKPELNAFVTLDEARALKAAREFDKQHQEGHPCQPLGGVPVVIKANIQVQGLPATDGTPALKDFIAPADAPVVARLRAAGAIVMGITTMHETAYGVTGYNPLYRYKEEIGVRNAYDPSRISGGSSSGNCAALGARMALAAIGTDTGGSVRIPCSFNGCAALRPTVGRYPTEGIAPLSHTRDTPGPMAQSIFDLALIDQIMTGGPSIKPANLKGVRLGVVPEFMANQDDDTRSITQAAFDGLRAAGVTFVDVEMPRLKQLDSDTDFPIVTYEVRDDLGAYLAKYHTGVTLEKLVSMMASPDEKKMYEEQVLPRKMPVNRGETDLSQAYEHAMRVSRPAMQKLYRDTFRRYRLDAFVLPTEPRVAPKAGPGVSDAEVFQSMIQNTGPGSVVGVPGLTLPSGLGEKSGLPIGLEIDGPEGSDSHLLSIGMSIEGILGRLSPPK
jgi:mandelamide amidase